MNCWICKRSGEELTNLGVDSQFEEFEIDGKDFYVCGNCNTLIELISSNEEEAVEESADNF